ncbi:MAG TPA: glycosyltransferase family 2 protein [Candidatus Dormibacteraeota bacterium]|nr:glycosyltransferase family 2 protein [Candidatus Dormibacteraeota bacterium]
MSATAKSLEISAVLPAFNEEGNLEHAVARTAEALAKRTSAFEIIVVDDGSQDGSAALLDRLKSTHPSLRVIRHPRNRGYGAAVRSGVSAAQLPWVFMMDADNQFDPSDIEVLVCHTAEADIVTGYRKQRRDPLPRRLNAWAFFSLVRLLFGRQVRDVNCAFKLLRRDILTRMDLRSNGALINTEVFVLARRQHARIVEVPVNHYARTSGKQTGADPRVVLRAFKELLAFRAEIGKAA